MKKIFFFIVCLNLFPVFTNNAFPASPVKTEHFSVIRFEGKVEQAKLEKAAKKLESAYSDVTDLLGITTYKSGKIEARVYGGNPIRPHASVTKINFHIGYMDIPIMRHELAHILIRKCLPNVPRWLNEGLAQYAENKLIMNFDRLTSYPGGFAFKKIDRGFANLNVHKAEVSSEEQRSYFYSFGAVSYLIKKYGKKKLGMLLLGKGAFKKRFKKVYGRNIKVFEKELKEKW